MKKINLIILSIFIISIATVGYLIKEEKEAFFHNKIINDNFVNHGNGLINDDKQTGLDDSNPFASKLYFKGRDVNNYFKYNDLCFRIVNITSDNFIKIMYAGISDNACLNIKNDAKTMAFSPNSNKYSESSIVELLNDFDQKIYNNAFPIEDLAVNATWYVGSIKMTGSQLSENIEYERGLHTEENSIYKSKIGLVSVTDYLKAGCGKSVYDAIETCGDDNFLFNKNNYWTLNSVLWDSNNVYTITNGMPKPIMSTNENYYVFPSLYLKNDLRVKGNGEQKTPYMLK